jgi:nucleotide-binding universal stress UspA family protein
MFKNILVPTDGSELSENTVRKSITFAKEAGAKLTFFNAMPETPLPVTNLAYEGEFDPKMPKRFVEAAQKYAWEILNRALDDARQGGVEADAALDTSDLPWQAIILAAEQRGCDLIFMASHGRSGFNALLMGSETHKVLTHCKIPVLVYR